MLKNKRIIGAISYDKKWSQEYYKKNKERILEYHKQLYEKNKKLVANMTLTEKFKKRKYRRIMSVVRRIKEKIRFINK
jgi:ABC-type phosphate/phosphonate transport system substrate-binding protein